MKFYFCEACGKRLTEHHIEGGVAKDKKLKGVYCKFCAVGVLTMETLPLSNEDAKQVLKAEPRPSRPPGPGPAVSELKRGQRRTSAARVVPATRTSHPTERVSTHNGTSRALLAGVAAAILLLVGMLFFASGRKNASVSSNSFFMIPSETVESRGSIM